MPKIPHISKQSIPWLFVSYRLLHGVENSSAKHFTAYLTAIFFLHRAQNNSSTGRVLN